MVEITPEALDKLIGLKPNRTSILLISVIGAGCSGLSYKLDWVKPEETPPNALKGSIKDFEWAVAPSALKFLKNLTIGYSGGLNGTGFTYSNELSRRNCGCGSSFGV